MFFCFFGLANLPKFSQSKLLFKTFFNLRSIKALFTEEFNNPQGTGFLASRECTVSFKVDWLMARGAWRRGYRAVWKVVYPTGNSLVSRVDDSLGPSWRGRWYKKRSARARCRRGHRAAVLSGFPIVLSPHQETGRVPPSVPRQTILFCQLTPSCPYLRRWAITWWRWIRKHLIAISSTTCQTLPLPSNLLSHLRHSVWCFLSENILEGTGAQLQVLQFSYLTVLY